jgi:hypothetical protein
LGRFFLGKVYALNLTKNVGWATFWAIFSKTHLVALFQAKTRGSIFTSGCFVKNPIIIGVVISVGEVVSSCRAQTQLVEKFATIIRH